MSTIGRPSSFTEEKAVRICELIAGGMSVRSICAMDDMPERATFFRWLHNNPSFQNQYARATSARADAMFEEMFEIADETSLDETGDERAIAERIQRSKLRVDTRKWALARMNPRKFGERVTREVTGPGGGPLQSVNANLEGETAKVAAEAWSAMLGDDD